MDEKESMAEEQEIKAETPEEKKEIPEEEAQKPQEEPVDNTQEETAQEQLPASDTALEIPSDQAAVAEEESEEEATDVGMDESEMLEAYDETLRDFEEGEIVKGVVVKIDRDEVMVDVGYKSEGYIPISEFGVEPDGTPKVKVGDPVDVYLLRKEDQDGLVVLSKEIADQKIVWDSIAEAYEKGAVVHGKVTRRIKGGLKVEIGNVKAFLPASQVELRPVQNFDRYIGKTLDMKVIKLSKRRRNIVLSRRMLLEEERDAKRQSTLSTLEPGQVREGVVKNITQFGAFIDLGGVDGLLHRSDMSWGRVNHPSEVVSVGDKVEVMVLSVDADAGKISLGIKQKTQDPWLTAKGKKSFC